MSLYISTLAAVVAALTDTSPAALLADLRAPRRGTPLIGREGFELTLRAGWRAPEIVRAHPWVTRRAEEAMELLASRELAPPADPRRAWVCSMCQGSAKVPAAVGPVRVACPACAEECPTCGGTGRVLRAHGAPVCKDCDAGSITDSARGWTSTPLTVPDVVVWAAVGVGKILAAEALAREAAAHFDVDLARVLWAIAPCGATTVVARYPCGASVTADGNVWNVWSWPVSTPRAPHVEAVKGIWAMGMSLGPLGADTVVAIDSTRSGEDTDNAGEETAR